MAVELLLIVKNGLHKKVESGELKVESFASTVGDLDSELVEGERIYRLLF